MSRRRIDLGHVLAVAEATTGTPVRELLAATDITLLSLIAQRVNDRKAVHDAAAEILVGVAAGRPFPHGNQAAAWALAALVVDLRRCRLLASPDDAVHLLRSARDGEAEEATIAGRLATSIRRRRPIADAFDRMIEVPPPPTPVVWACPACGRGVRVVPYRSSVFLRDPLPHDVVTDCAVRHRDHDRGVPTRSYHALEPHGAGVLVG